MKLILPLVALLFLSSCAQWCAQIVYAAPLSKSVKQNGNVLVHETDSIKISYSFWAGNGVMAFTVENKLNEPIYIDWARSSFIAPGGFNLSYYEPESRTISMNQQSLNAFALNNYAMANLNFVSQGITIKEVKKERITFVAPHSIVAKAGYHLMPTDKDYFKLQGGEVIKEAYGPGKRDSTKVYVIETDNPKLQFHNYITYATNEQMVGAKSVDDVFYVNKVVTMPEYAANLFGQHEKAYSQAAHNRFFLIGNVQAKIK